MASADPCFTCPLADCDDRSPACPARQAWGSAERLRRQGKPVPAQTLELKRWFYNNVYYPEYWARRAEAGTPRGMHAGGAA